MSNAPSKYPASWWWKSERSKVEAAFSLKLADYDIEAPALAAFVKVSQEIDLEVSVFLGAPEEIE